MKCFQLIPKGFNFKYPAGDIRRVLFLGIGLTVKLLIGLVVVRLSAEGLGPDLFGITGQLSSLLSIISLVAGAGIGVGITKVYAEKQLLDRRIYAFIFVARRIIFVCSFTLAAILIIFSGWIVKNLFINFQDSNWLIMGIILSIFPIGYSSIGQGIINGYNRSDIYALTLIFGGLLGLVGFWQFKYNFGPTGIFIGLIWMVIAQALIVTIFGILIEKRNHQYFKKYDISLIKLWDKGRILLQYGSLSIVAGALIPFAFIIIRLLIEKYEDPQIFGLWQATNRISEAYGQLPLLFISTVIFPRFARISVDTLKTINVIKAYVFIAILIFSICAIVFFTRSYWIDLVFTPSFIGMEHLLPLQLAGDVFRMMSYTGTSILAARGAIKVCIAGEFMQAIFLVASSMILIPRYFAYGALYAYVFSYIIYFIATIIALWIHQRKITLIK